MAILNPFECTVLVNGVAVEEYEDDDDSQVSTAHQTTKYVEAVSGANFTLRLTIQPGCKIESNHLAWFLYLDGNHGAGIVIDRQEYSEESGYSYNLDSHLSGSGSDWTERKFKFADIEIGETPADVIEKDLKAKYGNLGLITTKVWRYTVSRFVQPSEGAALSAPKDDTGVVPEKALKGQALSLSTSFGPEEKAAPLGVYSGKYTDKEPLAVFHFKYRSRKALQQLLILPRSPTPVPLEERDPKDLTKEEAQELVRRQRAQIANIQAVKEENAKKVKRERSSTVIPGRPAKMCRTESGHEYLELEDTDDEDVILTQSGPAKKGKPDAEIEVIDLLD